MAMPTIIFFFLRIPVFVVVGLLRLLQHEDRHQRRRRDQVRIMFICYKCCKSVAFKLNISLFVAGIRSAFDWYHIRQATHCGARAYLAVSPYGFMLAF